MKKLSLNKKMALLIAGIMLPLLALVVYLIISLFIFGNAYNESVENISIASRYNSTFQGDMDYTMYRVMINIKTYEELQKSGENKGSFEGDRLVNPYDTIKNAREGFSFLLEHTKGEENQESLNWIITSLDRLEGIVIRMEDNVKNGKAYLENRKLYDSAVLILTSDIQDAIQLYVQNEAQELEAIRGELELDQQRAIKISLLVLILSALSSFIISKKVIQSVVRPIQVLCEETKQIGQGDFTSTVQIDSSDEIQVLASSFNTMKGEIGKLIDDITVEQKNLRATELKLLQAQINPHFLYNTLDTIVWLAEGGQNEQVVAITGSLSEFFRTVLSQGKDFVSVKEEESHINSYLRIQQCRYQDIMDYEIHIAKELLSNIMLKLTLQPLIENAIYHGIKNKRGKGKIIVNGFEHGGSMIFEVIDNGQGMSAKELDALRQKVKNGMRNREGGFGLANVNERIQMTYGIEYGLHFESELGKGTTVTLNLPARGVWE